MSGGMGAKKFMSDAKSSSDILNWKEDGSIVGFIHPDGFHSRQVYWLAYEKKDEEGDKEVVREPFNCPGLENGCPICQLREYLKAHDEIEDDEVIYSVGKKKKKVEIMKGDALNLKDYDWKLSMIPSKEYLFGFVDVDNVEGGVAIIIASAGLSRAISACMENRMDDVGDEEGDPLKSPYALKFVYKEKETPANRYKAFYNDVKLAKEIKKLLEATPPNFDALTKPSKPSDIWKAIKGGLSVEGFEPEIPEDEGDEEETSKKKSKKKLKKQKKSEKVLKKKKKVKDEDEEPEEDEEVEESEEDEEEEESKSKKKKKKVKKQKEEKKSKKKKKKVKKSKDEDEEEESEEDEEDEDKEPCPNCGKNIPLSAEKCPHCKIEFVLDEEDEDEEDEDEEGDEDEDGEDDDEGEDDEDDDEDEETIKCPYCEEKVPAGKKRCPECGEKLK